MAEDDIFVSLEVIRTYIYSVHTHDSDISDVAHESVVEFTITSLSYLLSSQCLEFHTIIH